MTEITLGAVAREYYTTHQGKWSPKHRKEWLRSLENHVPGLLAMDVNQLNTAVVRDQLAPVFKRTTVTACRIVQRLEAAVAFAIVMGYRTSESNPCRWANHLSTTLDGTAPAPVHHPADDLETLKAIFEVLAMGPQDVISTALRLVMLTGARVGECTSAEWRDVDLKRKLWTVPPSKMKGRLVQRYPLSDTAVALLKSHPTREGLVFPGPRRGTRLKSDTLLARMRREDGRSVHGIRSCYRDWLAGRTSFEIAEACLAHRGHLNGTTGAYLRTDFLDERRVLAREWARESTE
jgi:integrase